MEILISLWSLLLFTPKNGTLGLGNLQIIIAKEKEVRAHDSTKPVGQDLFFHMIRGGIGCKRGKTGPEMALSFLLFFTSHIRTFETADEGVVHRS
jgi:hypothetical protein